MLQLTWTLATGAAIRKSGAEALWEFGSFDARKHYFRHEAKILSIIQDGDTLCICQPDEDCLDSKNSQLALVRGQEIVEVFW
jgi:hypothetical protein